MLACDRRWSFDQLKQPLVVNLCQPAPSVCKWSLSLELKAPVPNWNWRIWWEQSFTARMPLLMTTSAFRLGSQCQNSPQCCNLHRLRTTLQHCKRQHFLMTSLHLITQLLAKTFSVSVFLQLPVHKQARGSFLNTAYAASKDSSTFMTPSYNSSGILINWHLVSFTVVNVSIHHQL